MIDEVIAGEVGLEGMGSDKVGIPRLYDMVLS